MTKFARVFDGKVLDVIVADQDFIDTYVPDSGVYIQTWKDANGDADKRYNYAGVGYVYDKVRDAFYPKQPYPSYTLNEDTCLWESPVPYPDDGEQYIWNEETQSWDAVETE